MFQSILASIFFINALAPGTGDLEFSIGPRYSNYRLYQDDNEAIGKWGIAGELGIANIIPNVGIKVKGTKLKYQSPFGGYAASYEYMPFTFCTSFNLLPFLNLQWFNLSLETGIGVYFWKGLDDEGQIVTLPEGGKMEDRDIGFVGGFTIQLRPFEFIGLEFSSCYHYIASTDIYKYGLEDKDEKLWENGFGIKITLPLFRR
jgi:hypothetical protein